MRGIPAPLIASFVDDGSAIAWLIEIVREDGFEFRTNSVGVDLEPIGVGGRVFPADPSFLMTAYRQDDRGTPGAIDLTLPIDNPFSPSPITRRDLMRGLWNSAQCQLWVSNWKDPSAGTALIASGLVGEVTFDDVIVSRIEFQSVWARSGTIFNRTIVIPCDAELGDDRCSVDMDGFIRTGSVTGSIDRRRFVIDVPGESRQSAANWWPHGEIRFDTGANEGLRRVVQRWEPGSNTLTLWHPFPGNLEVGDEFTIHPGCDKSYSMCRSRFDNGDNHQGHPYAPGKDAVYTRYVPPPPPPPAPPPPPPPPRQQMWDPNMGGGGSVI
jgi:uncharacterized phage protein (TIGR02218 family)